MPKHLEPLDTTIDLHDGTSKSFVLHKFPAIAGREILAGYPLSALPKLAEYKANEQIMLKLMSHVGVRLPEGNIIYLETPELVDNHVGSPECLVKLELAMLQYNFSFFLNAGQSIFGSLLSNIELKVMQTLTTLLEPLLAPEKQLSKSSEKSTL